MHKIKSAFLILALVAILVVIGFMIGKGSQLTGTTTAVAAVACYEDQDCDDHIGATTDVCLNPGTEDALCVNRPVK